MDEIIPDRPVLVPGSTISSKLSPDSMEWNLQKVGAPTLWNIGITGQGIVYANADTGVQWNHPALINHYRGYIATTRETDHNYNWWDAISQSYSGVSNPCGLKNLGTM